MLDQELKKERLLIRINEADKEYLREYAKQNNKTMSQIIREFISNL